MNRISGVTIDLDGCCGKVRGSDEKEQLQEPVVILQRPWIWMVETIMASEEIGCSTAVMVIQMTTSPTRPNREDKF